MSTLLILLFALRLIQEALAFQNCPLLGKDFPPPKVLSTSPTIQSASSALKNALDSSLSNGTLATNGSSFSIEIFSVHQTSSLFTYHHSSPLLQTSDGVRIVDSESIYRVGSISKLFTAYLFLIEAGDVHFNDPITKFVPELAVAPKWSAQDSLNLVQWDEVTIGELASHMGGIPRDYFGLACPATRPCSRSDFFALVLPQPPVFPTSTTPVYSNIAYQILSYSLEQITNRSFPDMLQNSIINPLNLSRTTYFTPPNSSQSVMFGNATSSGWDIDYGDFTPAGGIYSSSHNMATVGRSILTSSLLPPPLTRRWLKPRSHTSNPLLSVGAPWEIYRYQSTVSLGRIIDLYTKSGDLTNYHSIIVLVPDLDVGFVVLEADFDGGTMNRNFLSDMITDIFLPAVENMAREEAGERFGGRYFDNGTMSEVIFATQTGAPGLGIMKMVVDGVDLLADLEQLPAVWPNPSVRLYPSGLVKELGEGRKQVGWRAVYESNATYSFDGLFDEICATWFSVDGIKIVDDFGIDDFTFTVTEDGKTESVSMRGFNVTLLRA